LLAAVNYTSAGHSSAAFSRADVSIEVAVMFSPKTLTPLALEAILRRIAEIDHKFEQADSWLRPMLVKDARKRELLVGEANRRFDAGLKHEWR
jgi:hypothetical protein